MSHRVSIQGQSAYEHDEGDAGGYFHTFDELRLDAGRDNPRKVHVFLPREYGRGRQTYPVLYMNDGHTAFWPGGVSPDSWAVARTLGDLYQGGQIRPLIVVAVHPLDRNREYLHVGEAGLVDYAAYLVRLKEFVDTAYRTHGDRAATCILGSSHGGLAAFYTGCMHGRHFGNVGALSPSFWVEGEGDLHASALMARVGDGLGPGNPCRPCLWIDWGLRRTGGDHNARTEADATRSARAMVALLQRNFGYRVGLDLFPYEDPTGGHEEATWGRRLGLILKKCCAF